MQLTVSVDLIVWRSCHETKCALQLFARSKANRSDSDIITLGSWSVLSLRLIGTFFFLLEIENRCCISTTETAQWQHSG